MDATGAQVHAPRVEKYGATRDEMSYPDWSRRLAQAERESRAGKTITLDAYIKRRLAQQVR